ncbi:MAG: YdeI/OmpD-associated family protein [Chitinophagaceae bacterium]|jgi:hypothetical protein
MIQFTATIHKFGEQGEKTGWTYIEIPADIADELNPGVKKSYRVKGLLDKHPINGVAIIPMGGGTFILAVNAAMRKAVAKKEGAILNVRLELDSKEYQLNERLVEGIETSARAKEAFFKMPRSHQNYYSKWIDSAKQQSTQEKRIVMVVMALERGLSYGEMLREQSASRK